MCAAPDFAEVNRTAAREAVLLTDHGRRPPRRPAVAALPLPPWITGVGSPTVDPWPTASWSSGDREAKRESHPARPSDSLVAEALASHRWAERRKRSPDARSGRLRPSVDRPPAPTRVTSPRVPAASSCRHLGSELAPPAYLGGSLRRFKAHCTSRLSALNLAPGSPERSCTGIKLERSFRPRG